MYCDSFTAHSSCRSGDRSRNVGTTRQSADCGAQGKVGRGGCRRQFFGTVLPAKNGNASFARAYGLADRERKTANTLEILCRERMDPASPQAGMSTANTRIGAGFLSLAVARSVSRRRVRFEGAVGDFLGFVQIAMRQVRSGRAARRRYGLGMGRVK